MKASSREVLRGVMVLASLVVIPLVAVAAFARWEFARWETVSSRMQRLEAAPSCYIGHLATMESKALPSGQIALHFSGWMEGGEKRITQFERSVPVWPAQEPHVLMCVQFSPSDSANFQ